MTKKKEYDISMAYEKGRKVPLEQIEKAFQTRFAKYGKANCVGCGKEFSKHTSKSVTCGQKKCALARKKLEYEQEKIDDPAGALARRLTGTIRHPNKKAMVKEKIVNALGKPCTYCGDVITIENASLDHKKPRNFAKVYNKVTKKREYSYEELLIIDSPANLHIVCRECNQYKNDLDDEQYRALLAFFDTRPDIAKLVRKRLKYARVAWQKFTIFKK